MATSTLPEVTIGGWWDARPPLHSCTGYRRAMRTTSRARSQQDLPPSVIAWRAAHGLIALGFLASIGYVWWCALSGRRGRFLRLTITALVGEGALVVVNRGNCPLGPLGDRIGDPLPLFELVLSPRAARLAVPALGVVTAGGFGVLAARSRSRTQSESRRIARCTASRSAFSRGSSNM